MLLTVHVLTGATVGLATGNFAISAPVCFATHAVLDALPHWSFPIPKQRTLQSFLQSFGPDLVGAVLLYAILTGVFWDQWLLMTWGVAWAILPDWLTLYRNRRPWKRLLRPFYAFHNNIQWEVALGPGLAIQAIVVFFLVLSLLERLA